MEIAIIGSSGMVGHTLLHTFRNNNIHVVGIGRKRTDKDIIQFDLYHDWEKVKRFLLENNFDIIFNCSGILVNESNINRLQAVYINSLLPHLLIDLFMNSSTKIIHLSTGGIFSDNEEFCFEDTVVLPKTYYGITKAAGEFNNGKDLVIRSDFWGPDIKKEGVGLFSWFVNQNNEVKAYERVYFNGISNIELARIALELINYTGIINIGTEEIISKSNLFKKIKYIFKLSNITLVPDNSVYKNISLKSRKALPSVNDYDTMIQNIYCYLINNEHLYKEIYPNIYNNK